jgi:hypothetical protein
LNAGSTVPSGVGSVVGFWAPYQCEQIGALRNPALGGDGFCVRGSTIDTVVSSPETAMTDAATASGALVGPVGACTLRPSWVNFAMETLKALFAAPTLPETSM